MVIDIKFKGFFRKSLEKEVERLLESFEDAGYYASKVTYTRKVFYIEVDIKLSDDNEGCVK